MCWTSTPVEKRSKLYILKRHIQGQLAQLVRAQHSHCWGHWFESSIVHPMKIFIICSKHFYNTVPAIKKTLEANGHAITLPNCYDDPATEDRLRAIGNDTHAEWKATMLRHSADVMEQIDAVLVLNFDKHGVANYIGGATFLEMYDAFRLGKKIFLYSGIPSGILADEIIGFNPTIINGDLNKIA